MLARSLETVLSTGFPKSSCRCRLFSSVFETKTRGNNNRRQQRHPSVKNITPVSMKNANWKVPGLSTEDKIRDSGMKAFRKDYKKEIRSFGDVMEEPDVKMFSRTFDTYMDESERLKTNIKRQTMFRKHFRDLEPREVSLLTWAEKENIRYLNETDPGRWTPEAISEAYPISPHGVHKLLKSSLRLRRSKDVLKHDELIAQRIKDIKTGKVPMTPDLEERLKIRDAIPLRVGDLGMTAADMIELSYCKVPKVLGEFAKLVASPVKEDSSKEEKEQVVKYIKDGEYYNPSELSCSNPEIKPEMTKHELSRIVHPKKVMTFGEFEFKMKKKAAVESLSADMNYMLNLKTQSGQKPNTENILSQSEIELPNNEESSFPSKIHKYKAPDETGTVSVTVEGKEGYIYQPDTGYQKPYEASPEIQERITIPDELRKPGATYKVGDCYYDEDGEFLYRVF
ncbi:unnamed protein product [Orchesella dallaii]|uniref:Neurite outgrowth-associated protein n=1 Tax=Orchesella dallaii TaxID=48710 RepID=A0ABP1S5C2_9HEXA